MRRELLSCYLTTATRLLDELQELEAGIGEQRGEVRGRLRLSAPVDFGARSLMPCLISSVAFKISKMPVRPR